MEQKPRIENCLLLKMQKIARTRLPISHYYITKRQHFIYTCIVLHKKNVKVNREAYPSFGLLHVDSVCTFWPLKKTSIYESVVENLLNAKKA